MVKHPWSQRWDQRPLEETGMSCHKGLDLSSLALQTPRDQSSEEKVSERIVSKHSRSKTGLCQTTLPTQRERQGRRSPILEQTSTPASTGSGTIRSMERTQSRPGAAMGKRKISCWRSCHPTQSERESTHDVHKWLQKFPRQRHQQPFGDHAFDCPPNRCTNSDPNLRIRSRQSIDSNS